MTYVGFHGCRTDDLVLILKASLTKSTVVHYLSVKDLNFLSDHRPILLQLTRNYNFLPNKIIKDTKVCELKHKPTRSIWKNSLGKDFALQLSLEKNKVFHVTLGNESDTNFKSEIEHTLGEIQNPVETDVFKTSSGYLEKVPTSYNQSRCRHDVWKKTSDLQCLEDI